MRTLKFIVMVFVAVLATGCASRSATVVSVPAKPLTIEEQIEQIRVRENLIKLRAEKIRTEERIKEAQKELYKQETPEERKARGEVEKAEKEMAKAEKASEEAIRRASITGCAPGTVRVHPRVAPGHTISSSVKIRVTNSARVAVDIEDVNGTVVWNLCPNGAVTIFRARNMGGPDRVSFQFKARVVLPDGSLWEDKSPTYRLSSHDWSSGRGRQEGDWSIKLKRSSQ